MPPAKPLTDPACYLPPAALQLAQVIGVMATLRLCEEWPGIPIRIPETCPADHAITRAIGSESAAQLSAYYGGETITPPRLHARAIALRDEAIRADRYNGKTGEAISREYGLTIRHVWRIVSGILPESSAKLTLLD